MQYFKASIVMVLIFCAGYAIYTHESQQAERNAKSGRASVSYGDFIRYMWDSRTDLCFAHTGAGNTQTLTNVPCTPEVLKAIEADRSE